MTWVDNKQWKYEQDQKVKRVLIKTFDKKSQKLLTWTVVKYERGEIVFSKLKAHQPFVNEMIQEGIIGESGERFFPNDGLDFLKQLKNHFNGHRMVASDVIDD